MADKSKLEQMLESLVNDDQAKAEELFHEYVVAQSRLWTKKTKKK